MALPFNPELKVSTAFYNNNEYIGMESISKARMSGLPELKDFLNTKMTYMYGSSEKFGERNFPVLFQTQGQGKKRGVTSVDGLVRALVLGKPKQTSVIAKTIHAPNAKVGKGYQLFDIIFRDRFFMKNQIIMIGGMDSSSIHLHIHGDPKREGKGWRYSARITGGNRDTEVPFAYLQAGSIWAGGPVAVSLEHSRGTESRSYYPYQVKNYLNALRQSINLAGNAGNKYLNFTFNVDGKSFTMIYEWEKFLTERKWNSVRDTDLVMSKLNVDRDGIIENVDSDSGKPTPRGMGLWWQIPPSNEMTYSVLTENLFENYITDMLSITDQLDRDPSDEVIVDIMAGNGFLMEVDKALKRNVNLLTPFGLDSNLIVSKNSDGGLTSGAYFTQYKHRSGVTFRFTHYAAFDRGPVADSAPRHPMYPNHSITSFNAMIMNFGLVTNADNKTEGNIVYLYEEGREYIEGFTRGMSFIEGRQGGDMATDVDASSRHMMVTQGIHVNYPMSMGKITCKIS